jgi:hypothetical protein
MFLNNRCDSVFPAVESQGKPNLVEVVRIGAALPQPVHRLNGIVDRQPKPFENIASDPADHGNSIFLGVPVEQIEISKQPARSGSKDTDVFQSQGPHCDFGDPQKGDKGLRAIAGHPHVACANRAHSALPIGV